MQIIEILHLSNVCGRVPMEYMVYFYHGLLSRDHIGVGFNKCKNENYAIQKACDKKRSLLENRNFKSDPGAFTS